MKLSPVAWIQQQICAVRKRSREKQHHGLGTSSDPGRVRIAQTRLQVCMAAAKPVVLAQLSSQCHAHQGTQFSDRLTSSFLSAVTKMHEVRLEIRPLSTS